MDIDKKPSIIIDNGSYYIKSGFGTEDNPRSCIRNIIGYPKKDDKYSYFDGKDYFIGKQAKIRIDDLDIKYPVKEWKKCGVIFLVKNYQLSQKNIM